MSGGALVELLAYQVHGARLRIICRKNFGLDADNVEVDAYGRAAVGKACASFCAGEHTGEGGSFHGESLGSEWVFRVYGANFTGGTEPGQSFCSNYFCKDVARLCPVQTCANE